MVRIMVFTLPSHAVLRWLIKPIELIDIKTEWGCGTDFREGERSVGVEFEP